MKRSILFVINTLGIGGAERALISLISALPEDEFDIDLLVVTGQGELVRDIPDRVNLISACKPVSVLTKEGRSLLKGRCIRAFSKKAQGFKFLPYIISNGFAMLRKGKLMPDKLLWRLLSDTCVRPKKNYDLAVAYIEGGATYFVADHVKATRKVAFVHIPYSAAGYTRGLDRNCYRSFDRIYAVSEPMAADFAEFYPELRKRVGVFENLIDTGRIKKMSLESGFTDGYSGHRIVSLLRLTSQKAVDVSVETMALLKSRGIQARWYVFGDGDERGRLEDLIRERGLESDFILCGTVPNPYPFIREADIYVHASRFEGRSIAVREAMALGAAVIVSDVPGNRDHIKDGVNGLLCRLEPEDIVEKIISLISDQDLCKRLGENAAREDADQIDPVKLLFE